MPEPIKTPLTAEDLVALHHADPDFFYHSHNDDTGQDTFWVWQGVSRVFSFKDGNLCMGTAEPRFVTLGDEKRIRALLEFDIMQRARLHGWQVQTRDRRDYGVSILKEGLKTKDCEVIVYAFEKYPEKRGIRTGGKTHAFKAAHPERIVALIKAFILACRGTGLKSTQPWLYSGPPYEVEQTNAKEV